MGRTIESKAMEIHRRLENKLEGQKREIEIDELEKEIMNVAGIDERTIKKYKEALETLNRIKIQGDTVKVKEFQKDLTWNLDFKEMKRVRANIPKELYEKGRSFNLNFSEILSRAILNELNSLETLAKDVADTSEKRALCMMRFIGNDLHKATHRENANKRRKQIAEEIFDYEFNSMPTEMLEDIRQDAFKLAEKLGFEKPPKGGQYYQAR